MCEKDKYWQKNMCVWAHSMTKHRHRHIQSLDSEIQSVINLGFSVTSDFKGFCSSSPSLDGVVFRARHQHSWMRVEIYVVDRLRMVEKRPDDWADIPRIPRPPRIQLVYLKMAKKTPKRQASSGTRCVEWHNWERHFCIRYFCWQLRFFRPYIFCKKKKTNKERWQERDLKEI